MIAYTWYTFETLTKDQLYLILRERQRVFVVEQSCAYQDLDDLDRYSHHLLAYHQEVGREQFIGYLRVVYPGKKYPEPAIGRLLTNQYVRRKGIGKKLMSEALNFLQVSYPGQSVRISAQLYLEKFYRNLGFSRCSGEYDEDGIPHVEMMRPGNSSVNAEQAN